MMLSKPIQNLLLAAMLFASCAESGLSARSGMEIFTEADPSGNTFACATCHSISTPAPDGFQRVGHPLDNVTRRPSYKNGQLTDMLDAVNSCREEWMLTSTWSETDSEWQTLHGWLDERATQAEGTAIAFTIDSSSTPVSTGDRTNGQTLFNNTCATCHGNNGIGTQLAPVLDAEALEDQGGFDYIWRRVRTSGVPSSPIYQGLTGGRMPFWSIERLSDADLADIAAFVMTHDNVSNDGGGSGSSGGNSGGGGGASGPFPGFDTPGDCPKTHAKVGHVANLSTKAHGVDGVATIENDCTIRLDQFDYDGLGIVVNLYADDHTNFENYDDGFAIGGDLKRSGGYENATLYFVLPSGKTMDDVAGVSIWCVTVGADFGSGAFSAP